jgi:hypothetical protein
MHRDGGLARFERNVRRRDHRFGTEAALAPEAL